MASEEVGTSPVAETKKKKSDLGPRAVTAALAVPLLIGLVFFAPAWGFGLLVMAAGAISAWEYCSITYRGELRWLPWLVALLTFGVLATMWWAPASLLPVVAGSVMAAFMAVLFGYEDQERSTHQLGSSVTAIMYAGLMLGCLALMRQHTGASGPMWVIMVLGIIWGSDTGAYFAGRAFGRHKLYPAVSPNKTIEGALGGVVTSLLLTFGFDQLFRAISDVWVGLELWQIALLAIPGNALGQVGDLAESLVKRAHGVKDSGTIVYGHGGMLDRIDALIFASPWFYFFVAHVLAGGRERLTCVAPAPE